MFSPIRGEVAEITGKQTLVLNIGANKEVKKGMRFVIYEEDGQIYDFHGADLGMLEIPKAEVEVYDVQPKLCLARNVATKEADVGPWASYRTFAQQMAPVSVIDDLPVAADQINERKIDKQIKKGDKVRQIL